MNLNSKDKETYWTQRAEQRLINAENLTSDMMSELKKTYKATLQKLEKELNAFYGKYATENGLTLEEAHKRLNTQELKSFKEQLKLYYDEVKKLGGYSPDTKDYLRSLSVKAYISRLEELQAQIRWQVENLYREQQLKMFGVLQQGYEDTYLRATFDMQQGMGVGYAFSTLDDRKVRLAVTQKWQGSNFSDRIWTDKAKLIDTINQSIPSGIALGKNPKVVARDIAKSMNTRFYNAERLARTEMNHIANEANKEAYKEVPEVLQQYKIVATLDNRTSDICQEQDGKVYKMSEWEEGITAPPFHPSCRSSTVPYFDDVNYNEMSRIAQDYTTGQAYYVPADMTYKEWRDNLTESQEKAFISNKKAREQHSDDVKQLSEYRKLQTYANKHGQSELFDGMPRTINEYQSWKYTEPEKYEILKENVRIIRREMK